MELCEKSGFSQCLSFCNIPTGTRIALRLTENTLYAGALLLPLG